MEDANKILPLLTEINNRLHAVESVVSNIDERVVTIENKIRNIEERESLDRDVGEGSKVQSHLEEDVATEKALSDGREKSKLIDDSANLHKCSPISDSQPTPMSLLNIGFEKEAHSPAIELEEINRETIQNQNNLQNTSGAYQEHSTCDNYAIEGNRPGKLSISLVQDGKICVLFYTYHLSFSKCQKFINLFLIPQLNP